MGPQEMLSQKNNIGGAVRSLVPPFYYRGIEWSDPTKNSE
jgi:hypothetical protein